jgi:hypothetical protein
MAITNTTINDLVPSEKALGDLIDVVLQEKNPLVNSGLATTGPEVSAVVSGGPRKQGLPFLLPLDATNVNIGTDNITEAGDTGKLVADEFTVVRHDHNWSWGTSDLARMVTQYDAEGGINAGIGQYWLTRFEKTTVSSIKGVKAHIDAVISAGTVGTPTSDQIAKKDVYAKLLAGTTSTNFAMATVFKSAATAEEYQDMFDSMIVHPTLYAQWQSEEASGFLTASQTGSQFATYKGFKLIKSTSFGETQLVVGRSGGVAFGTGFNEIEKERIANGGKGAGGNIVHSRQSFVSHVQGTNYAGPVAPTLAQLETATSWNLAIDPIDFGFRFISYKKPA